MSPLSQLHSHKQDKHQYSTVQYRIVQTLEESGEKRREQTRAAHQEYDSRWYLLGDPGWVPGPVDADL